MTNSLDEAIKNCEKVADGFDEKAQEIAMQDESGVYQPRVSWFQDLASRQRQLADWLRELKAYKELNTYNRSSKCSECKHEDSAYYCDDCIWNYVNKFEQREINADE